VPTVPAREFHGRDTELALIRGELERLSDGAEAVVVVEGAAGMGKSRLLEEVAAIARSLGIRVGRSAADPSETVVELAALLAALFDGTKPLLDPGELSTLRAQPEQRFWLLRDLQQLLERAALESPLLIAIDDAHWADGGTTAALRTLPMRLMGLPIAWMIALRPQREATPLVYALEQLKQDGAHTIILGPLDDDAIEHLARDMLAAQPDQSILEQLAEADGSPFLIVETLLGLQEEERIRVVDRQAAVVLLEAGALPVEVAVQLAASAEVGDEVAIATLLDAAKALVTTDPDTAAQFGQRALEIAPAHHPQRGEIVATTAIALHIAGESEQAIAFADRALRETLPALQEAEVRLSIAGMFAISPEIRIGAGRLALNLPDLPETLRARHLACVFQNLVTAGRLDEARAVLEDTRATVESAGDARATFTLRVAESALEYADDRFGPSHELITEAYRDGIFAGDDQRLRLAHMWHGELLSVADRSEEALAIAADGLAAAQRDQQGWAR